MNKARKSITTVGIAVLFAACGSGAGQSGGSGGNQNSGTGGNQSDGSGGNQNSGTGGNQSGGSGGNQNSGTGGNQSGGSGGDHSGGSGGNGSGGATAKGGATGSGGSGAGGTTAKGGATGSGGSGAGGNAAGGSTSMGTGGAAAGGTTSGSGGGQAGGAQGTGGTTTSPGTGGATTVASTLITSASGNYWKTGTWTEVTSGTADVTVNDTSAAQNWEGFGGAFNELGWSQLSTKALQDEAMGLLFGTDGAHFTWGRIPMGASDYAIDRYTCDETANDTSMASFSISRDQQKLIPYIKAAQAVKSDLRFWASPWTPPTWMKTGQKTGTKPSPFDGGNMKSDAAILTAYALYYTKFVQGYKDQGINIEIVSPQNEPGYDQNYPSCLWDKATYVSWVKALGPAMSTLGVKVMLGTLSNAGDNSRTDLDISAAVLADSTAKGIVTVVGVQWGVLDKVNGGQTFSGLPIWATEHKCGNYPWNPSGYPAYVAAAAPNDQAYGVESWGYIRDAINKGKVTSYSAWNMVLDKVGKGIDTTRDWAQDSLLTVSGGAITKTPAYYVFRHFSQFVDPGAKVVSTSGSTEAVAFKNSDGSLVAVVYSSAAKSNYIVKVGGKMFQFSMPAGGWATVKYKP
jgi:glucosylceramidase